jgi:aspartyl-tRNA synthetase
VIAFPKNQAAICPLTSAPTPVTDAQLNELHVRVKLPVKAE